MAISLNLIGQGLTLINFLLNLIWGQEVRGGKKGDDKHAYVSGAVESWMNEHGVKIRDLNGFIKGFVKLLRDHELFESGDKSEAADLEIEE